MRTGQPSMIIILGLALFLNICSAVDTHSYKGRLTRNEVVERDTSSDLDLFKAVQPAGTITVSSCATPFASTGCTENGGNCNMAYQQPNAQSVGISNSYGVCTQCIEGTQTQITGDNVASIVPATTLCTGAAAPSGTNSNTNVYACAAEFATTGCQVDGGNCTTVFVSDTNMCLDCIQGTNIKISAANVGTLSPAGKLCTNTTGTTPVSAPCVTPFRSTGCTASGGNCSYVYVPSMLVCGECFEGTNIRITPENSAELTFAVELCNAVQSTEGSLNPQQAAAQTAAAQNATATTTTSDVTPLGHVFAVLCGALFIIFLPAAYVTMQGKNGKESGGGGRRYEDDDDTRTAAAGLKANRDS